MMKIRLETKQDERAVENLTREAFWNVYRPGCFEHLVIHKLRKDPCFVKELDYVVEEEDLIIASIVYAKGTLTDEKGMKKEVLLFGPVSVLPEYQHKGYGDALIRFTMDKAKELGYPAIFITGNPEYYHRFGFEACSKYQIHYEGMDVLDPAPFFMVKVLRSSEMESLKGTYSDPSCYVVTEEEVEEFDQGFPMKTKEKREGQLC